MDDLLLITPSKRSCVVKLEDLLKALLKNRCKIYPKKCQLFRTELQHMDNTIFIKVKRICIKPLRSRLEVIHKMQPPTTVKGYRRLAGIVIKHRIIRLPILYLPNIRGRFHLYSDTSKFATGSALYQNTEWKTKTKSICK